MTTKYELIKYAPLWIALLAIILCGLPILISGAIDSWRELFRNLKHKDGE